MQKPGVIAFAVLSAVILFASVLYGQDELYEKGRRAYLKKDYKTAVKYLSEYVAVNPDAGAYYLLGYAKYELLRKTGPPKGKKDFWGDTRTAEYFKDAYLIDPNISARSGDLKKK
jgi:tetratricopeptide (TPR) repeat protein